MVGDIIRWQTDVLVIGGGIAAAFAAIKARDGGADVIVVDKAFFGRGGCSALASGVFKAFLPGDDMANWIRNRGGPTTSMFINMELFKKGAYLSYECARLMEEWGVRWVKDGDQWQRVGSPTGGDPINLMLDGGGPMMMMALRGEVLRRGVRVINRVLINDLLTSDGRLPTQRGVVGAIGVHTRSGEIHIIEARKVIMATGPFRVPYPRLDRPYRLYSMPIDLSGDGHAAMLRAGAAMGKLELGSGSLNPWHFYTAPGLEMLSGLGGSAIFTNAAGERFLVDSTLRQSLFGRAAVGVGIAREMREGRGPVSVDITHFTPEQRRLLRQVIPIIMNNWEAAGFNPTKDAVPYALTLMATHSVMGGGAHVNEQMEATVQGLYAAGNCSDGSHMTMAQTLPECAAMGYWAGEHAGKTFRDTAPSPVVEEQINERLRGMLEPLNRPEGTSYKEVHEKMENLYSEWITYTLTDERGRGALRVLRSIIDEDLPRMGASDPRQLAKVIGIKNFLEFLEPVLTTLLHRKESRGNVLRPDYPFMDNQDWLKYTFTRKGPNGQIAIWDEPLPESRLTAVAREKQIHPFFME
jgi:succinate dehydrogenase / fumarate reductase flavoprotein subunit